MKKLIVSGLVIAASAFAGYHLWAAEGRVVACACSVKQQFLERGLKEIFDYNQVVYGKWGTVPFMGGDGVVGSNSFDSRVYIYGGGQRYHLELFKTFLNIAGYSFPWPIPDFYNTHVTMVDTITGEKVYDTKYPNTVLAGWAKLPSFQGPVSDKRAIIERYRAVGPTTSPIAERQPPHIPGGSGLHRSSHTGINSY